MSELGDPYDRPVFIQGHMHAEPICAWPDCRTSLTRDEMAERHRMTLSPPETPLDRTVRLALADGQCRAALERVRALHDRIWTNVAVHGVQAWNGYTCTHCQHKYPCATVRALDQPDDRPP